MVIIILGSMLTAILGAQNYSTHFIEAESFENKGGWVLDQQFMDVMGSSYLMAHGLGVPVEDASTLLEIPSAGRYYLFVRTMNWVAPWTDTEAPGRFRVSVDRDTLEMEFGAGDGEWRWTRGGILDLKSGRHMIHLHDLTGFNGRCDAVVLTSDPDLVPPR